MPTEVHSIEVLELQRIQVVDVLVPGIQGPKGDQGEPGPVTYQITVSATPPPDPEVNQIWIDIS